MAEERQEVYERIPWETLEKRGPERQWLLIVVAGAVVAGALAYSFMQSRPASPAAPAASAAPTTSPGVATAPVAATPAAPTTTAPSPMLTAEADLYAVDPEHLANRAAAHAEWFAVEYFSADGSEESRRTLQAMMPAGVPLPEAGEGVQVFVDWVGAQEVAESGPLSYSVEVVVRSLAARGDEEFVRQPARVAEVEVVFGDDGEPRVLRPPTVAAPAAHTGSAMTLSPLPETVQAEVEESHGPVVGGEQLADGGWRVVAMVTGADGVSRPTTVTVP